MLITQEIKSMGKKSLFDYETLLYDSILVNDVLNHNHNYNFKHKHLWIKNYCMKLISFLQDSKLMLEMFLKDILQSQIHIL